ncbi:DUF2778 domain-containing protein [Methylobacterium sp. WSM2598]|uniref:DUF2778 domain-containing protein n=1 Tax=Methylobacterium sp. WSM2598 TaxID=398261 RepID=UPI00037CA75B|nr:DUF2778 domain-containing protein [Methylobacterium sp. WSM2598]
MGGVKMVLESAAFPWAALSSPGRRSGPLAAAVIALAGLAVADARRAEAPVLAQASPAQASPAPPVLASGEMTSGEAADPAPVAPPPEAALSEAALPEPGAALPAPAAWAARRDPLPLLAAPNPAAWQTALLDPLLRPSPDRPADPAEAPSDIADAAAEPTPAQEAPAQEAARLAEPVPLPVPRPPELRRPRDGRLAERAARRAARPASAPATPAEDTRNLFEKLFGLPASPSAGPGLAYAALETSPAPAPSRRLVAPMPGPDAARATAIYDISARIVTLPSGERLEAHSGLGDKMDDPRFVHVPMRGATPPGTYDLTERERLFHGVRAIRLNPVGGPAAIHGRVGLLAHTYMLGPSGASNGCVSFRHYDRFLQAFLRGEVRRMVVVAGRG